MEKPTADELRKRLVEIVDEVDALADDDFARRYQLLSESDACRAALSIADGPASEEAAKEWAERAGRKGAHEIDPEVAKGLVRANVAGSGSGTG